MRRIACRTAVLASLAVLAAALPATSQSESVEPSVRRIPIETPKGPFGVWTRTLGSNPNVKVLVLHGGPGFSHDYLEPLERLAGAGFEVVLYDQLGSGLSDRPDEPDLWEIPRFVDEVEQVRRALGLDARNFVLYGHSWGGILAIEYALAHPDALAGLVISNMMASIPAYNEYAENVLMPEMDPAVLAELKRIEAAKDYENPRYMELLIPHHYEKHVLRMPAAEWPAAVNRAFEIFNPKVYVPMQGPSELGASGKLAAWDRSAELAKITVPTLVVGARHDTMDPEHLEWMAGRLPRGRYLFCPQGSHMAMWDDGETYFEGLAAFLTEIGAGARE